MEWHSVKPNTLGLKVLRTKTPARRPMINNMISISRDGKPCVSEDYSILFIYNSINLILVRVERKSLIRKTLILIRVPFVSLWDLESLAFRRPLHVRCARPGNRPAPELGGTVLADAF